MLMYTAVHSFSFLYSIPLYKHATMDLSILYVGCLGLVNSAAINIQHLSVLLGVKLLAEKKF